MPTATFTTAIVSDNTVFFAPDADLLAYDPTLLTTWTFEFKPRSLADGLRAADAVYDVLDSQGIKQIPGDGYPVGSFNAALQSPTPWCAVRRSRRETPSQTRRRLSS